MASWSDVFLFALIATAFWSLLGYAVARRLLPRPLAAGVAPVLGWAVHSAATLPLLELIGFSPTAVIGIAAACAIAAAGSLFVATAEHNDAPAPAPPAWAYAAAAILALAPALAIMPKFSGGGVFLADPIFDHSKVALIDAMTRQGLPPVNPIFGAGGAPGSLAYYYLWHFSAAQLALALRVSGWEADIGLTWFTAFASLSVTMALAVWLAGNSRAALIVVVLAVAASLRPVLHWMFGVDNLEPIIESSIGFSGWLFQSAWAPQHLMSASCAVTTMLLIARYASRPSAGLLVTIILSVVAGFESSTYVGGVTLAIAAVAAAPILLLQMPPPQRLRFAAAMALAAVLAAVLAAPFMIAQVATVAARHDPTPVVIHPFEVFGDAFPSWLARLLDLPAYWLIELPIEFPAAYIAGIIALVVLLRVAKAPAQRTVLTLIACLAGAGLVASWLLASTLGDVNDLALRAVLPAVLILIAAAAAGIAGTRRRTLIAAFAFGGLALSLPHAVDLIRSYVAGGQVPDAAVFARTPQLWQAVRRYAGPTDRVANNPLFLKDLTPWPVNMSWALLADRSSCFAGRELALAFAPLPASRREAISEQFIHVFDGKGTPADINAMANTFGCKVVVVVPQDGAWTNDPFATSPDYRLAEEQKDRWRIYLRSNTVPSH